MANTVLNGAPKLIEMPARGAGDNLSKERCFELVERVCGSSPFRRSIRLCEFLRYVCRRALDESASEMREQEVGKQVFGRRSDYDTTLDPIVRVQASHLRKKLQMYFDGEGAAEAIVLDIPKGGYLPAFRVRTTELPTSVVTLFEQTTPRNDRKLVTALSVLSAILAVFCGWLIFRPANTKVAIPLPTSGPYEQLLWSRLFISGQNTSIVVSDAGLGNIQNWTGRPIDLKTYLSRDFTAWLQGVKLGPKERQWLERMNDRFYTTGADLNLVRKISQAELASAEHMAVFSPKDYNMREANTENIVLLGSQRVNPWVELFSSSLNFQLTFDDVNESWTVWNRAPQSGEAARYDLRNETTGTTEGYATIAFLPNLAQTGNVLILSGTDMNATESAGELTLTESRLAQVLRRVMPVSGSGTKQELPYFEILMKTRRFGGAPREYQVLAWRRITAKSGSN